MLVVAAHILTGKGERSKETSTSYIDECERVRGKTKGNETNADTASLMKKR